MSLLAPGGNGSRNASPADRQETPTPAPVLPPEVEGIVFCRPDLFIRPEVAGLCVPITVLTRDGPVGDWRMCLQWPDGKREIRPFQQPLLLPGDQRLWLKPLPGYPSPEQRPGWSADGRQRWLAGETPDPAQLLRELSEWITRFVVFPEDDHGAPAIAVSLWTMLTYCYPAWSAVPYLHLTGSLASGKSRVLQILAQLARRPTLASSMTASVLFRTLHTQGGTLLLDEAEQLQGQSTRNAELRTALLAGYKTGGRVLRMERCRGGHITTAYEVFAPKALASIGDLSSALASRCIRVSLLRVGSDRPETRRRLDAETETEQWQHLRDALHAFALTHASAILRRAHEEQVDAEGIGPRDAELWGPLLALATICENHGEKRLTERLKRFAEQATADRQDAGLPAAETVLLEALADQIVAGTADITPQELLLRARQQDAVTFSRWTPHRVASVLRRYGLQTHKTRAGRRSYHRVTPDQLRRIEGAYGLTLLPENATIATNATSR